MAIITKGEHKLNIGADNDFNIIWGGVIDKISNSGLVSSTRLRDRTLMWTTRLCKSNFALEDVALNDYKIMRLYKKW